MRHYDIALGRVQLAPLPRVADRCGPALPTQHTYYMTYGHGRGEKLVQQGIPMNSQTGNKGNKTTRRAGERGVAAEILRSSSARRVVLFFLFPVWLFIGIPY